MAPFDRLGLHLRQRQGHHRRTPRCCQFPRSVRDARSIFAMICGILDAGMISSLPPQWTQPAISMPNTRFNDEAVGFLNIIDDVGGIRRMEAHGRGWSATISTCPTCGLRASSIQPGWITCSDGRTRRNRIKHCRRVFDRWSSARVGVHTRWSCPTKVRPATSRLARGSRSVAVRFRSICVKTGVGARPSGSASNSVGRPRRRRTQYTRVPVYR